jgi:hypothetical protein
MFTAIASSQQRIRLHRLQGAVMASTRIYIARAQGGQLHDPREMKLVTASDAEQASSSPTVPLEISRVIGRWPDQVWGLAYIGMAARAIPGPQPEFTIWVTGEAHAVVHWDGAHGRWVEHPEIAWIGEWADGVLAAGTDGKLGWADGSDRPLPPVLAQGIYAYNPYVTRAGDAIIRVVRSPLYGPGWWIFPRGECKPERFEWPPGVDEQSADIFLDHRSNELFASGTMKSGEGFVAHLAQERWRMLPPLRGNHRVRDIRATPSGQIFLCTDLRTEYCSSWLRIYRLTPGGDWENVPIPFHMTLDILPPHQFVASEEGELWLEVDFGGDDVHRAVLYHARA